MSALETKPDATLTTPLQVVDPATGKVVLTVDVDAGGWPMLTMFGPDNETLVRIGSRKPPFNNTTVAIYHGERGNAWMTCNADGAGFAAHDPCNSAEITLESIQGQGYLTLSHDHQGVEIKSDQERGGILSLFNRKGKQPLRFGRF